MITDKIDNISAYDIPIEAINFVRNLSHDIELGRHVINENIYANVEKYNTKSVKNCRFETHRDYIDIQILLSGKENIYYTDVHGLNVAEPYNSERDIEFYSDDVSGSSKVTLDGSNFMLIYPHEAHAPQAGDGETVLKVVVKIKTA